MNIFVYISVIFGQLRSVQNLHNYARFSRFMQRLYTLSAFSFPVFTTGLYKREVLSNVNGIRVNVHVTAIFTARFRGRFRALISALSALYIIHGSALAVNKF